MSDLQPASTDRAEEAARAEAQRAVAGDLAAP
jgi:hypothetical protein